MSELFDVLRQLGAKELDALIAAATRRAEDEPDRRGPLRLVCRAARSLVDDTVLQLSTRAQEQHGEDGEVILAPTDLHRVLEALPRRWPGCTQLVVRLGSGPAGPQRAAEALLDFSEGARQLKVLYLDQKSMMDLAHPANLMAAANRTLQLAVAMTCPQLRVLDLCSGLEPHDRAAFRALSRLPHLEELVLPGCSGVEHVGLLAGLRSLTIGLWNYGEADVMRGDSDGDDGAAPGGWPEALPVLQHALSHLQPLRHLRELCCLTNEDGHHGIHPAHVLYALSSCMPPSLATVTIHTGDDGEYVDELSFHQGQLQRYGLTYEGMGSAALQVLGQVVRTLAAAGPACNVPGTVLRNGRLPLLEFQEVWVGQQLLLLGDAPAQMGVLTGGPLRELQELLARCDRVEVTAGFVVMPGCNKKALEQAVQLFGLPKACASGWFPPGRLAGRPRLVLRGGAQQAGPGGAGPDPARLPGAAGAAGDTANGSGGSAPCAAPPTPHELLRVWVEGAEEAVGRPAADLGRPDPQRTILILVSEGLQVLKASEGALEDWCEQHVSPVRGRRGPCLVPAGAVAVRVYGSQAAEALQQALPAEVYGQPLRVLRAASDLQACTMGLLQRYLDQRPGGDEAALKERLSAVAEVVLELRELPGVYSIW